MDAILLADRSGNLAASLVKRRLLGLRLIGNRILGACGCLLNALYRRGAVAAGSI